MEYDEETGLLDGLRDRLSIVRRELDPERRDLERSGDDLL